MTRYLMAIDQGTTNTSVLLVDEALGVRAKASREHPQIYPQPGWVEHDPEAIWASVVGAIGEALERAGARGTDVAAIGITNQRETTLLWSRRDGRPAAPAVVWQDRRTAAMCQALSAGGLDSLFRVRTGLVLDPYFAGTKVRWLLDHTPGLRARAEGGEIAFGTVDAFLVWRLSGGLVHATDPSNASRTLLYDIRRGRWDEELLAALAVPAAVLPQVRGSAEVVGATRDVPGLPDGIPVAGIAGDQQAALFGQGCFAPGDAKCTYGTGAFLLMNVGAEPVPSARGLLTTVAWSIGGRVTYALEGSAFIAGAMVQWLRDGLGLLGSAAEIEAMAASVPDSGGVVVVPALSGLGAPHWRPEARGIITGLTRGTTRAHLARAVLEGIALQNVDLLEAMQADAGRPLTELKVDGGAAANDLLMQIQSDVLGVEISRPAVVETTALGAACLAGLAIGIWPDTGAVARAWREERRFRPRLGPTERADWRDRWGKAVSRA